MPKRKPAPQSDEWPELLAAIKQVDPALAAIVDNLTERDAVQHVAAWMKRHGVGKPVEAVNAPGYERRRQTTIKGLQCDLERLGRNDLAERLEQFILAADPAQTKADAPGARFSKGRTLDDWSQDFGLSRNKLSTMFQEWASRGMARKVGRKWQIAASEMPADEDF